MIRRILVPLDRSELSERAIETATALASAHSAIVRLAYAWPTHTIATVDPLGGMVMPVEDRADANRYLDAVAEPIRRRLGLHVETVLVAPPPAQAICEEGYAWRADLIVMATHGRTGWSRFWLGSVADEVVRRAGIPVWLVRADDDEIEEVPAVPKRVLIPLDGSSESEAVLMPLADCLRPFSLRVRLMRVVAPVRTALLATGNGVPIVEVDPNATERAVANAASYLNGMVPKLAVWLPNATFEQEVMIEDSPAHAILDAAVGQDLVALATHARGMSRLLIGSVADKVLRGSSSSLFGVRRVVEHAHELPAAVASEVPARV